MKAGDTGINTHITGEVTTLATCWKLVTQGGTTMGFTDHDADIVYSGVTYAAATGITPSAAKQSADLAVDNLDVFGAINAASITQADIEAGVYDYADVYVFWINWADTSGGIIKGPRGKLGEVRISGEQFVAEVRSLSQLLNTPVGGVYSAFCRAELGTAAGSTQWWCGVSLGAYTDTGTVTGVTDNRIFTDSGNAEAADYYNYGVLTWTSGNNNGRTAEVKDFGSGQFTLREAMPDTVQVGDTYSVYAGCDKSLATCRDKFNNVVNFKGEPYIPGDHFLLRYGGQ